MLTVLAIALAADAIAFDLEAWLQKREMLVAEAARLRAAYSNCVLKVRGPAEDVTIPIETFPDGSVKTTVHAAKAQFFLQQGLVWAEDVTLRKVDAEGATVACIKAKSCVVDRHTRSGWADGPASVTHGETVFRGEGIYFSSPEGYVMVTKDSDVRSADLKFGGIGR